MRVFFGLGQTGTGAAPWRQPTRRACSLLSRVWDTSWSCMFACAVEYAAIPITAAHAGRSAAVEVVELWGRERRHDLTRAVGAES